MQNGYQNRTQRVEKPPKTPSPTPDPRLTPSTQWSVTWNVTQRDGRSAGHFYLSSYIRTSKTPKGVGDRREEKCLERGSMPRPSASKPCVAIA